MVDHWHDLIRWHLYDRQGRGGKTMLEAMVLTAVTTGMGTSLALFGLDGLLAGKANHQAIASLASFNPLLLLFLGVAAAPVYEEALFRGLPLLILRGVWRRRWMRRKARRHLFWVLGGTSAVLFALMHRLGSSIGLPLPQLVAGLWLWRVANLRGLRYSILLHATYNSLPILIVTIACAFSPSNSMPL